jgi:hypothetical protein
VFHLQMALGNTNLAMSRCYSNLAAADLVEAHRPVLTSSISPNPASKGVWGGRPYRVKGAYPGGECATAVLQK